MAAWLVDDTLYWKSQTPKGEALTHKVRDLFSPASQEDGALAEWKLKVKELLERLPFKGLDFKGFTADQLMEKFRADQWQDLFKTCLACGTCTFICPTCHCYDIQDFDTGKGIRRYRCWDSCMYSDFTLMAHGNPRPSRMERFRQRYMHKLIYFSDKNDGAYACVGCGRCVAKCPISMNIVKVIQALGEGNHV